MKKFTRILAMVLTLVMVLGCLSGCKDKPDTTDGTQNNGQASNLPEYTYRGYTAQLGTNWNPHTYETDYDSDFSFLDETGLEIYREKNYRGNRHLFIRRKEQ